jgi:hypothetical protein
MMKGHGMACFMWLLTKLAITLGVAAWIGAMYLQYTESYWYMYDSVHMYLKAIMLLVLSIVCRMCYKDRKKQLHMKMAGAEMVGGCGSCGEGAGGCSAKPEPCCGEEEEKHHH